MTKDGMILWGLVMMFWGATVFIAIVLARIARSLDELVKMAYFKVYTEDESHHSEWPAK